MWTLLQEVEVGLLIAGCGLIVYVLIFWRNGGRDSLFEAKEIKDARWGSVFKELNESEVGSIPREERDALSRLAQKCGTAMKTLVSEPALDLCHKGLDDDDGPGLAALLRTSACLESMDLSHNELGNGAVSALAAAAPHAKVLVSLNLTHNALHEKEAGEALGQLARRCGALRELHAGQNHLADGGGRALASALREPDCALKRLTIPRCLLGDEAAYALGAALNLNSSLRSLSLWGNPRVTAAAQQQLRTAWGQQRGPLTLDDDE